MHTDTCIDKTKEILAKKGWLIALQRHF
jgi:hypothetical protein